MASTLDGGDIPPSQTRYARRISSHLAAALVTFALLQILIIAKMGGSLVLHLGIIVAIGGYAMAARVLEHRWTMLDQGGLPAAALAPRFRRDLIQLWSVSLFGAMLWIPVALLYRAFFG